MASDFEAYLAAKLSKALTPSELVIRNDSALHQHHAQSPETGDSHFFIRIVSSQFVGLSAIQRHRLVYKVLEDDLKQGIHALSLDCQIPE